MNTRKISNIVSYLTHPIFLPLTLVLLLSLRQYLIAGMSHPLYWLPQLIFVVVLTLLLPLLIIVEMKRRGIVDDIMMRRRETRTMLYGVMCLIFALMSISCHRLNYDFMISLFCVQGALLMAAILLINLKWKISIHCAGVGVLTVDATLLFLSLPAQTTLIVASVTTIISMITIYARLDTGSHTRLQCIAGYALGTTVSQTIILASALI